MNRAQSAIDQQSDTISRERGLCWVRAIAFRMKHGQMPDFRPSPDIPFMFNVADALALFDRAVSP